jgi:pantoate--beta-alanine ligase
VATVVVKLLAIVQPDLAIFGEKDRQQCEVVERVVRDLYLSVRILRHPTVREEDGLPMSSRNLRLNPRQRELAGRWATAVRLAARKGPHKAASVLRNLLRRLGGIRLEYAEVAGRQFCAAAWIGKIRLIDHRPCKEKI